MESLFILGKNTIPQITTEADWAYGDPAQLFPVAYAISQSLQDYCVGRTGSLYNARMDDDACADSVWPYPQGFGNYFTQFDIGLQLLTSYGISGDITVPTLNEFGVKVLVSLVRPQDSSGVGPAVPYCTPLPRGTEDRISTGLDVAKYINQIQAQCSSSAVRRRNVQETRDGKLLEVQEPNKLSPSESFEKVAHFGFHPLMKLDHPTFTVESETRTL